MAGQWWKHLHRIVQTNLQLDQADMDVERLVRDLKDLNADGLVFNVGGIYAWYPSQVPFHTVNPLLKGRDLVGEVVEACHKAGILFIARFDFSKAEDATYFQRPEWFIRLEGNKPQVVAPDRPGAWSLLMSTCTNGEYQREGVAFPVLREVLGRYDVDGAFITSMFYAPCNCEVCQEKYRRHFDAPLPPTPPECDLRWFDICTDDSIRDSHRVIHEINPDVAFFHRAGLWANIDSAAVYQKTKWWFTDPGDYDIFYTCPPDVVHGETHNQLSSGAAYTARDWVPAATMNLCRTLAPDRPPLDIVHSAPGLNWRHTGLPPAEHMFWLSQVGAAGGTIWHSLTGTPETQQDRRMLETVREYNRRAALAEPLMEGAKPLAQVGLMWNSSAGHGWVEALTAGHIPYTLLLASHTTAELLSQHRVIIFPECTKWSDSLAALVEEYVAQGGSILLEGRLPDAYPSLAKLAGCRTIGVSEALKTAYFRLEDPASPLGEGLGDNVFIPFAGTMFYEELAPDVERLCTLVPPFAPEEGTGSPPERAMMLVDRTEIPAASLRMAGGGKVLHLPYAFHRMLDTYRLPEHYRFAANCVRLLAGAPQQVIVNAPKGVQLTVFEKDGTLLVHLVNGVGSRPLGEAVLLDGITVKLTLEEGKTLRAATTPFGGASLKATQDGNQAEIVLDGLDAWQLLVIEQ